MISFQFKVLAILALTFLMAPMAFSKAPLRSYQADYVVFSRDSSQLVYVTPSQQEIVKIQARTGKVLKRIPLNIDAKSTLFAPTPDGFKLLTVHEKGIDVIHNGTGKVLRTLPHPSGSYDWKEMVSKQSIDGVLFAIPSMRERSPKIYLIHTGSGKIIRTIDILGNGNDVSNARIMVNAIGFSPNKRLLAYTIDLGSESRLYVYDISRQQHLMNLEISKNLNSGDAYREMIHFTRDSKKLVVSGINQKVASLVNLEDQSIEKLPYAYSSFIGFSADDKKLIVVQPYENSVTLRDLRSGKSNKITMPTVANMFDVVVQSFDRRFLALPLKSADKDAAEQILLLDGNSGAVIK